PSEAEPLLKRSLAISEAALGPNHPEVATTLNNLAALYADSGRPEEALAPIRRATAIRRARFLAGGTEEELYEARHEFLWQIAILEAWQQLGIGDRRPLDGEAFGGTQLTRPRGVPGAVGQMAVRFAAGDDALATLVRQQQDLAKGRQAVDRKIIAAIARP